MVYEAFRFLRSDDEGREAIAVLSEQWIRWVLQQKEGEKIATQERDVCDRLALKYGSDSMRRLGDLYQRVCGAVAYARRDGL